MKRLQIISSKQFKIYNEQQKISLLKHFNKIKKIDFDFSFLRKSAAVYSSNIEGNPIDLETYYKYYTTGMNIKTKSFKEINNLEKAYQFAQKHVINEKNLLKCHYLLSEDHIENKYRGKYRDKEVFVMKNANKIVYTGAKPEIISNEIKKLFADIDILKNRKLTIQQSFYFASMIHLVFVAIHPFADGNGRAARLLEKWFLANKLGKASWGINSEKLYLKRSHSYHKNINKVGDNYNNLNFDNAIPFLKMLPMALRIK